MENILELKDDSFSFWKNLVLFAIFFTITPATLAVSLFSLFSLGKTSNTITLQELSSPSYQRSGVRVYASLPASIPSVSGEVEGVDARPEIVKSYLERYNSPLVDQAQVLVETADKYTLDFRLVTAIAQQESNLCKIIPPGSYNCWGWGIHSRGTLGFTSFEEGIETVSKGIREEYLDKGYKSVEDIMSKYTPLSNGSWAAGVNQFMSEME